MANNAELLERLPQESMKAYAAFCAYRDLGPDRSMAKAGEVLGKSQGLMEGWSAAYDWVKRATAWDDEQDRVARKAQMDEIKKMRVRHAKIAQKALDKVSAALDKVNPDAMTNADMARLMDVASKLERLSRGDVGEVVEERDGGQAPNPVSFYIPANGRDKQE